MTSDESGSGHAFGALVARLRASKDLTQKELARRLNIARTYLANIERGELPGPNVLQALMAWYPEQEEELRRLYDEARALKAASSPMSLGAPYGTEGDDDAMFRRSSGINPKLEGKWYALWLTTVEQEENVNAEELSFKWHKDYLHISNQAPSPQNPKGGYLWRAQCRLYDNQYIMGTYVAVDPLVRSKGTLYLVIHRSGTFILGHWVGCNYDSDWAHGLVAIARDTERLPALLRSHVASYPAMPYWDRPAPRIGSEGEPTEPESVMQGGDRVGTA